MGLAMTPRAGAGGLGGTDYTAPLPARFRSAAGFHGPPSPAAELTNPVSVCLQCAELAIYDLGQRRHHEDTSVLYATFSCSW